MDIAVFGANGATGRLLVRLALDAGHRVAAITRHPDAFPFHQAGLRIVEADVYDAAAVSAAIEGCDAVLSTLGIPFTRDPIAVYSLGAKNIVDAMHTHRLKRLAVVSSSATYPHRHTEGGFLLNNVLQPIITATIGKTTYEDMRRMEEIVRRSDLDWTIIRPSGLFELKEVTEYRVDENEAPGVFTARIDLAACMLAQLGDTRFVRKNLAVTTTSVKPKLVQVIMQEAFKKN